MAARSPTCSPGELSKTTSKDLLYSERFPESRIPKTCVLKKLGEAGGKTERNFVVPQSQVMERLKDFLPKMRDANEELMKQFAKDPDSVSLEVPEDSNEPHIEMECFLMEMQSSDSSSDSDSDSNSDEEAAPTSVTAANLKVPGHSLKRARPLISEMEGPPCKAQASGCERRLTRSVARCQKQ